MIDLMVGLGLLWVLDFGSLVVCLMCFGGFGLSVVLVVLILQVVWFYGLDLTLLLLVWCCSVLFKLCFDCLVDCVGFDGLYFVCILLVLLLLCDLFGGYWLFVGGL